MNKFQTINQKFDVAIIGSGAAGLMAAIEAVKNGAKKVAVISKVIPTNSHTVAAKGGINAALGNVSQDDWKWHVFDTIKGSDYLADEDAVEILCKNAKDAILYLEKIGVVFSRDEKGQISQRAYGGQTLDFGKGGVAHRACYSKDKTGQTILHSLYSEAIKHGVEFFSEFFVCDLLMRDNSCLGFLAIDLTRGELVIFHAKTTIIATGGYSQIYRNSTSSLICTGDGNALALKAGLSLQDMEFVQFHPTGIAGKGFLISEAARGEGAHLLNSEGERFMKNYAPQMMELSSRDIIARAIATEILEGRGCGKNKDSIHLDLTFLSDETLSHKLPGVVEVAKNFARIDVKKSPIEIAPTAHYTMGGISTNIDCQVVDFDNNVVKGLMAIGETACVSVHGANRLGCNSLLDLIVFGKIAGKNWSQNSQDYDATINKIAEDKISQLQEIIFGISGKAVEKNIKSLEELKNDLQNINEKYLGVFRSQNLLELGFEGLLSLIEEFKNYDVKNKSLMFNDELILYFELKNLFFNSFASFFCAIERKESRGSHYRQDFEQKDDLNWRFHSVVKFENGELIFRKKEVR